MVIVFSFTPHSLLFVQKDLKEILFTTEGAEHTEEMIKDMFYLLCLLCVARSASVYSVVQNGFLGGGYPALKAINLFTKRLRDAALLELEIKTINHSG